MNVEEMKNEAARPAASSSTGYPAWFQQFLADAANDPSRVDEIETARRREVVRQIDELREEMSRKYGVQPDSTPLIRAMRDHE